MMRNTLTRWKSLSVTTLVVFGLLIIIMQITSIHFVSNQEQYNKEINLAGRQRMLSQKIAKEILSQDSLLITSVLSDVTIWKQVHQGLYQGNIKLNIKKITLLPTLHQLNDAGVHLDAIASAAEAYANNQISRALLQQQVRAHEQLFLEKMDHTVHSLEVMSEQEVSQFKNHKTVMTAVALLMLSIGFFLIFRPIYRKIVVQETQISEGIETLQRVNKDMEAKLTELALANNELQAVEEELRMSNEEQLVMTEELEHKMQLSNKYIEQLATAQEVAKLGYWSSDLQGTITWSDRMYSIFDIPQQPGSQGPTLADYQAVLHPEDRELSAQKIQETLAKGEVRYQLRIVGSSGATRYINTTIKKHSDYSGKLIGVFGVSRDITDEVNVRKTLVEAKETAEQAKQELQKTKIMLEQTSTVAGVGGWEMDCINDTIYWSQVTRDIHEADDSYVPDLETGINFYKEGASRETIQRAVAQVMETGQPFHEELVIITCQGNERWVRTIGRAEFREGMCIRLYGTFQDITEEITTREALIEAKKLAEHAAQIKQDFLANMSHEIRTPMNAILGFTRLLLRLPQEPESYEYLQAIYESADTLLVVINDVLDFSKIESGKLTIEQAHFRVEKVLDLQQKLFSIKLQESNVKLVFDTDYHLPPALIGDPVRISQVLNNLIGNAVKFTEKGIIQVITSIASQEEDTYWIEIAVKDTGIGIANDKLDTIFDSFGQENDDTTRLYGGTGLGLTIVKKLVTIMGGEISVNSQSQLGSTFKVVLPLQLGDESLVAIEDTCEAPPVEQLKNRRILLTEDNRNNQMLAQKCLAEVGCIVDLAVNGEEAVRMVQEASYDVVLMDIRMPIMNGIEATKAIKILPPPHCDTPIIAMTAHALKEQKNQYRHLGMHEYVSKPFNPAEFYTKLINVLEGKYWGNAPINTTTHLLATHPQPEQTVQKAVAAAIIMPETDRPATEKPPKSPTVSVNPSFSWHRLPPLDRIEYTRLKEFTSEDEDFFEEMLQVFLEDAPEYLRRLEIALREQNWEGFKDAAHTLKSGTMLLGMDNMAELLVDIEDMELEDIQEEVLKKFYGYIRENCEDAFAEVRNDLT